MVRKYITVLDAYDSLQTVLVDCAYPSLAGILSAVLLVMCSIALST